MNIFFPAENLIKVTNIILTYEQEDSAMFPQVFKFCISDPISYMHIHILDIYVCFGHPVLYTDVLDTLYFIRMFWPPCIIYGCFGHPVLYTDVLDTLNYIRMFGRPVLYTDVLATLYYIRMFWPLCIIYGCFGHP